MTITIMAMARAITKVATIKMMMMITRLVQIINVIRVKVDVQPVNVVINMDGEVDCIVYIIKIYYKHINIVDI